MRKKEKAKDQTRPLYIIIPTFLFAAMPALSFVLFVNVYRKDEQRGKCACRVVVRK